MTRESIESQKLGTQFLENLCVVNNARSTIAILYNHNDVPCIVTEKVELLAQQFALNSTFFQISHFRQATMI